MDCSEEYSSLIIGYDYILNLSALKHVRSEKDPFFSYANDQGKYSKHYKHSTTCERKRVSKYFCVSTDKAANPVNMMGASKRIMEMFLARERIRYQYINSALQMLRFQSFTITDLRTGCFTNNR